MDKVFRLPVIDGFKEVKEVDYDIKKDKDKPRTDLIPPSAMKSLAKVLTFGAKKYKENSWRQVEIDRYFAALIRHYIALREDILGTDEESGLYHCEHLLCNAAFINDLVLEMIKNKEIK